MTLTDLILILTPILITLAVLFAVEVLPVPARLRRHPIHRTVLVVLESDTLRGTLLRRSRTVVVLGSAELLRGGDQPNTPIDGTVYIEAGRVRWIQSPKE